MGIQNFHKTLLQALLLRQATYANRRHRAGFTLIELLVVLVVIGVLTAVAIPTMASNIDRAKMAAAVSQMKSFADGIHSFAILNGAYPNDSHEAVPSGTDGYINGTAFMEETPLGGRYNFDYFSGGDYVGISISSFDFPLETRERLDSLVDGEVNLSSGVFIDSGHAQTRPTLLIERCNDGTGLC